MRKLLFALLISVVMLVGMPPAHAITWAGYFKDGSFTTNVGEFRVPRLTCNASSPSGFIATWIGIDGSDGLEQAGTSAWCSGGSRQFSVWYENYPAPPVSVNLPVAAGNRFRVSITIKADTVVYFIRNKTQDRQTTISTNADREPGSREFLAEGQGTLPPFLEIDFFKPGGFPTGMGSIEGAPFRLGAITGDNFWIRDARA